MNKAFAPAAGRQGSVAENRIEEDSGATAPAKGSAPAHLQGKSAAVLLFSHYPSDPRPRRAAEAMAEAGMRVEVIAVKQHASEPFSETYNGVRVLRLPIQRRRGGKLGYLYQYATFLLAGFVLLALRSLKRRYSVVHVHNMPDVLVFSALAPKAFGAKVILDLHDPMPELMMTIFGLEKNSRGVRLLERLEKWSLRFADVALVVNAACKRIFSERGCPVWKLHVIMNSPEERIFRFREPEPVEGRRDDGKPFVIMYHGSLVERHGLDLAVAALEKLRRAVARAELRIYGASTPFLEKVMSSVQASGLQESVRYLGAKDLEGIAEAIRQCDVGIIPNRRSIFTQINTPTRIFEYLSQGKPVIAPAVPGIMDYFGPEDLVFFELGNASDLAQKLEHVFANPLDVSRIIRRGQEVYLDHKWSSEKERFLSMVGDLLTETKQTALGASRHSHRAAESARSAKGNYA